MARPPRGPGHRGGCGCGSAASCPRRGRGPRGRCRVALGTSRWGAPRRPRLRTRPSLPWANLYDPDVRGLWALGALAELVLDLCAFGQRPEPVPGNRREVHERILAPVIGSDETEALLV